MDILERQQTILLLDGRPWTREALARSIEMACRDFRVLTFAEPSELAQVGLDDAALIVINATGMTLLDPRLSETYAMVRSCLSGLPIVVLSDSENTEEIRAALEKGLSGYIPISLELPRALDALRFVAAGGTFVPAELVLLGLECLPGPEILSREPAISASTDDSSPDASLPKMLTPREHSVLHLLSQGKSNKQIARELGIREATVKVHVRHMIAKFGATNRTQVALLAAESQKKISLSDR